MDVLASLFSLPIVLLFFKQQVLNISGIIATFLCIK
jgi:hypothetical protein